MEYEMAEVEHGGGVCVRACECRGRGNHSRQGSQPKARRGLGAAWCLMWGGASMDGKGAVVLTTHLGPTPAAGG